MKGFKLFTAIAITLFVSGYFGYQTWADNHLWTADYHSDRWFSWGKSFTYTHPVIDFNWGDSSPAPSLPVDDFAVRYRRTVSLDKGQMYRFDVAAAGYALLSVNGTTVINLQQPGFGSADVWLKPGDNYLYAQYQEEGGPASIRIAMYPVAGSAPAPDPAPPAPAPTPQPAPVQPAQPSPTYGAWNASYYNNTNWSGYPQWVQAEFQDSPMGFSHHWGMESPGDGVSADNFSAEYKRDWVLSEPGFYSFTAEGDDHVQVLVDGILVVDAPTPWQRVTNGFYLTAGTHNVVVRMVEYSGHAYIYFDSKLISANAASDIMQ